MVEELRAAPAGEDWPLAGWLAGRRTLAGSVAARLLWQPALSSGRAGPAMLHPALRAFVPAIPVARLFEPVAGSLQRRETSWSTVERFWWRRQAPELALLGRRSRWQITPVPVQREQAAAAPATELAAADLATEASRDEAAALERQEQTHGIATLAHAAEQLAGAPAAGEQPVPPASQGGPFRAIGRALTTVMRRLFPTREHAPAAGPRRFQALPGAAGDDAQRALPDVPGADAVSQDQAVPEAEPAQPPAPGGQGSAGPAPAGAIARQTGAAGPALAAPPEQPAAGPATSVEPVGPAPAPEGEEAPAAPAPAAAFRSSAGVSGEPGSAGTLPSGMDGEPASSVEQPVGAPGVVRRAVPAGYSPPGPQGTVEPAALPAPSLERGQPAPEGGMATLRLRALELWHRVAPRRARPAGEPAAPPVERAVEPAAPPTGRAGQIVVEMAGPAAETAPPAVEQTPPESSGVSPELLPAAPLTEPAPAGSATSAAPSPAIARASEPGGAAPAAQGPGLDIVAPAPGGEADRSGEVPVSSAPAVPPARQDRQQVSGAPAAPHEELEPAFQPWRPGEPRPAPADLIAPLAAGVLQRRGAETSRESAPAAAGPEQAAPLAAGAPGWPPGRPPDSWGSGVASPAAASPSGAASPELPSWAASLSEQLRRLQRRAQAEPSIQHETRQGTAPVEPLQVQRAASAGSPEAAPRAPAAGSRPPVAPPASSEPVAGAPAGLAGGQVLRRLEPPRSASLQGTVEPAPSAPPGSAGPGPARPITRSGPGPAGPALDAVEGSTGQEPGLAGATGAGASNAPAELAAFPPLVERLSARSRMFAARIVQRGVELPLANAAAWAEEHAAAAGGLATEVVSHISSLPAPGSALLPGSGETASAGVAPEAMGAPPAPEPGRGVAAGAGADAGPVSPYAAYLEAARAAGMLPGAPGSRRSAAQPRGSAARPFRLSEAGSEPAGGPGPTRSGAPAGIRRAAGHEPSSTSGAAMEVQRSAAGVPSGTWEAAPLAEERAPDRDELAQVLISLPPAMAAAALAKGVLGPQPVAPSRATTGAVEPALPWQPLTRVQAPALVARAPAAAAAGVEETEAQQPFAADWEAFESSSAAPWEPPAELPHALQRAAGPQPLEASGAPGVAGEQGPAAPGQAQAAALDRLADEVFELLRWRLAAERERMMR